MRKSSGLTHHHQRSKNKKSRKPARCANKSVQTIEQMSTMYTREQSPEIIPISSDEEEDLEFNEPQRFVIDEARVNEEQHHININAVTSPSR